MGKQAYIVDANGYVEAKLGQYDINLNNLRKSIVLMLEDNYGHNGASTWHCYF